MIVRAARSSDAAAVSRLLRQLGYDLSADRVANKLACFEANSLDAVFVAEDRDRLLGCIGAHAHELFQVEGRLGRIMSMIVDENERGRGVGSALLAAAEHFLASVGCVKIELTSADHRRAAHLFYEARGFRRDERRFLKVARAAISPRRD